MFMWHSLQRTTIKNKTAVGNKTRPQNLLRYQKLIINTASCRTFSRMYSAWPQHCAGVVLYKPSATPHQTHSAPGLSQCFTVPAQLLSTLHHWHLKPSSRTECEILITAGLNWHSKWKNQFLIEEGEKRKHRLKIKFSPFPCQFKCVRIQEI